MTKKKLEMGIPSIFEIHKLFFDEEKAEDFLFDKGVFLRSRRCTACNGHMAHRKCKRLFECLVCRRTLSIRAGSFFFGIHLPCNKILYASYLWLLKTQVTSMVQQTGMAIATITKITKDLRGLVSDCVDFEDVQIGGKGIVVEVDESKFGKRKYNRGHRVEGVWILGGVERTSERRVFLVRIERRDQKTLLDVLSRHILPGSIVHTDLWRGYYNMENTLGVTHHTVNHSLFFKDPITLVHTNSIEGTWNGVKLNIKPRNRVQDGIEDHSFEFIWRRRCSGNLWNSLISAFEELEYQ
jgi:transposase-like protein